MLAPPTKVKAGPAKKNLLKEMAHHNGPNAGGQTQKGHSARGLKSRNATSGGNPFIGM